MVVAGGDVGDERAQSVERRAVALLYLPLHVGLYLLHRHVTRPLDEGLHVFGPSPLDELAHGVELGKLCGVVGVVDASGAQSVAERDGNVVLAADVTDVVEV